MVNMREWPMAKRVEREKRRKKEKKEVLKEILFILHDVIYSFAIRSTMSKLSPYRISSDLCAPSLIYRWISQYTTDRWCPVASIASFGEPLDRMRNSTVNSRCIKRSKTFILRGTYSSKYSVLANLVRVENFESWISALCKIFSSKICRDKGNCFWSL